MVQLVGVELQLTKEQAEHAERFGPKTEEANRPRLEIRRKGNNSKMLVMEIVVGLFLAKVFYLPTGQAASLKDIVCWGERCFGVELPNYCNLKRNLFAKKKSLTPFLDQMRNVFHLEADRQNE